MICFFLYFFLIYFSLNANEVDRCRKFSFIIKNNLSLRKGPSHEYPIIFETQRQKILIAEKYKIENWHCIESQDGKIGWIESKYLRNQKNHISIKYDTSLMRLPSDESNIILYIKKYENAKILFCDKRQNGWCRILLKPNITGWIKKKNLWGIECYLS